MAVKAANAADNSAQICHDAMAGSVTRAAARRHPPQPLTAPG